MRRTMLALAVAFGTIAMPVQGQTFFGEDISPPPLSNASNAESLFLSNLIGVGTEDFEGFALGSTAPLTIGFGAAGNATLTGGGAVDNQGPGRFSVGGGSQWYDITVGGGNSFVINFTNPIAAFGFYGTDIGDFGGQLSLNFMSGDITNVVVPHTVGSGGNPSGTGLYFGYIDTANPFTSVEFVTSGGGSDVFGFDQMTIGTIEQVSVPEPGTMLLLASGFLGLGITAVRRREEDVA